MSPEAFSEPIPGIVVYEHSVVEGKNAIIFGSDDVLAVDACMEPSEASDMADIAIARRRRVSCLAITHGHPDHVFGSSHFKNVDVIAHKEHDAMVRRSVMTHAARLDRDPDDLYESLAHPSSVFEHSVTIDLGGRNVELFHTPGHTPDSICAFLPDEGVLVGSDTVVTGIVPAIGDGDSLQLESTLRELAKRNAALLIPGHGSLVSGEERVRDTILWSADYLGSIRERIASHLSQARGDLGSAVPYEEFVGDRFDADSHGMERRHHMVVEKILTEVLPDQ